MVLFVQNCVNGIEENSEERRGQSCICCVLGAFALLNVLLFSVACDVEFPQKIKWHESGVPNLGTSTTIGEFH